jgi:hypothetical protein
MNLNWMEELANLTSEATLKDFRNILRKNKIMRIYDLHL